MFRNRQMNRQEMPMQPMQQMPGPPMQQMPMPPMQQMPGPPMQQMPMPPMQQMPGPPMQQMPMPPMQQMPGPPMQQMPIQPFQQVPQEPTPEQIQQTVGDQYQYLKMPVLQTVQPWVQYGLQEAQHTSYPHALTEVAAIAYLIGQGYQPQMAHLIVESWEINEQF